MKQQCTCVMTGSTIRCPQFGVPVEGFDFFVCDGHLSELERLLESLAPEHRHAKN